VSSAWNAWRTLAIAAGRSSPNESTCATAARNVRMNASATSAYTAAAASTRGTRHRTSAATTGSSAYASSRLTRTGTSTGLASRRIRNDAAPAITHTAPARTGRATVGISAGGATT